MTRLWQLTLVAAMLLTCVLALGAHAQERGYAYATINKVEVQQLANAVRIVLQADGVLNASVDPDKDRGAYYIVLGAGHRHIPTARAPFTVWNARSGIGSFVNVSRYPVSHVEIAPMSEDPLGVGVRAALVLYEPAGGADILGSRYGTSPWTWRSSFGIDVTFDIQLAQDQKSIIITVRSNRYVSPKRPDRQPVEPGAFRYLEVQGQDSRLRAYAVNAGVDALVSEVAKVTGAALGIEPEIHDYVTLNLQDVTVEQFIHALARACGYGIVETDGRRVFTRGDAANITSYAGWESRSIPVEYIPAAEMMGLLPDAILPFAHIDPAHNAIVAAAPPDLLAKLQETVAELDKPFPQIGLDVITIETTKRSGLEKVLSMGLDRGPLRLVADTLLGSSFFAHTGQGFAVAPVGFLGGNLAGQVKAVASRTEGATFAAGHVTTLNGKTAELFAGQRRWVILQVRYRSVVREQLQSVDVGTRVEATPTTGNGQDITLELRPQVISVVSVDEQGLPTIATRRAVATVRVRAGDTVMIAGLEYRYRSESKGEVPVLSDIPLIGSLFKQRYVQDEATEAVMFVTPRIAQGAKMDIPEDPFAAPPGTGEKPWNWEIENAPDHVPWAGGALEHRQPAPVGAQSEKQTRSDDE